MFRSALDKISGENSEKSAEKYLHEMGFFH
jgi:hypothetical protein